MNRLTHRLLSVLMIVAGASVLLATEKLDAFPAAWHPYLIAGAAVLFCLSKSAQEVYKGE